MPERIPKYIWKVTSNTLDRHWKEIFIVTMIVFVTFVSWSVNQIRSQQHQIRAQSRQRIFDLKQEDQRRQAELQVSRINSCEKTYHAIRVILLASVDGHHLNKQQKSNLDHLLALTSPKQCKMQTKVPHQ